MICFCDLTITPSHNKHSWSFSFRKSKTRQDSATKKAIFELWKSGRIYAVTERANSPKLIGHRNIFLVALICNGFLKLCKRLILPKTRFLHPLAQRCSEHRKRKNSGRCLQEAGSTRNTSKTSGWHQTDQGETPHSCPPP
ncbi:hypothetical protein XU18_1986 [Perkinsela sp. CCAP 1560/4]|nr:hypothetical protein XU18_1986 [Perkinsela sp. CCAP 1560/4]|eukprot:KNH07454.1 hypothetical protein XU18_1986 [Perkinsela sp. CCAP 1560/4]